MWYVVKNEWGFWTSDHGPFRNFEDACLIAKTYRHMNVVEESLYNVLTSLPQTPGNLSNGEHGTKTS